MKRTTKAALLSGLVFPGIGQLYLKRYVSGLVLAVVAAGALYLVMSVAMDTALEVAGKIESGAVAPDAAAISALVEQPRAGTQSADLASWVLLACWVLGIADALRPVGRRDPGGQDNAVGSD